jgi:asparagine synthase (glutamine-hydrolysing)
MSLIYGVWSRNGKAIPREWIEHLLSYGLRNHASVFWSDDRLYLQKSDIGAFAPGWSHTDRFVTALAGDAILTGGLRDRSHDMAALDAEALEPLLQRSRGYFNLARYDKQSRVLTLANDRLGMRPLYVYDDGEFVVFSGALKLMKSMPGIRLTMDLTGVLQTAAFGYPLGERTHYDEIRFLPGGTIWREGEVSRYWTWQQQEMRADVETVMDEMYSTLREAVALRRGSRQQVFASLSGGLDSRCVATELWHQGAEVHSLNVSWQGSYDDILGRMYAEQLGFAHRHRRRALNDSGPTLAKHLWELSGGTRQIWAGDEGGVSIGHTKHPPTVIDKLRAGDREGAAAAFLNCSGIRLSGRLLRDRGRRWAERLPLRSLLDELPDCNERSIWLFRMRNQHRRILAYHFEQIDEVPFELIEPLADPELIRLLATLPIDFCAQHRMYHEWLRRFPPQVSSVAWQAYPESLPCPVSLPPGTAQWSMKLESSRSRVKSLAQAWRQIQQGRCHTVSRSRTALAYLLHGLGIRDTSHLLRQVELIEAADRT